MGNRHLEFRNIRTSLAAAAIALGGCASTDVVRHPVYKAISPTSYATRAFDIVTGSDTDETFTVNIPNDKGGYTAVIIRRSGNGFVGPQGEFYSEFPRVSKLKIMYNK